MLLQQKPKQVGVVRMKNIQLRENDELGYSVDDLPRLYNRNYYRYDKPIHEQIIAIKRGFRFTGGLFDADGGHSSWLCD